MGPRVAALVHKDTHAHNARQAGEHEYEECWVQDTSNVLCGGKNIQYASWV